MYPIREQDNACNFNRGELERLDLLDSPYILGLRLWLTIPFKADVSCDIWIQYEGEEFPTFTKSIVRTPYNNKRINALCNKIGRKQSKWFMPICFNSYEELQKVKRVMALWTIKTAVRDGEITEYVIQDNVITGFEEKKQEGTYGVSCYDYPYLTMFFESNGAEGFFEKHLSIKDGKVHSDILLGSEYDDVCFYFLEDDALEPIVEYHTGDIDYQVSPENDFIFGVMGFKSLKRDMQNHTSQKDIVSYYRSVVTPNDRGILA